MATVNSSGLVTGVAAGTATITYTIVNGSCIFTLTKVITVSTPPSAGTISGPNTFCETATTQLTASQPGGTWSSGNTAIATVNASGLVSGVSAGLVVISYTVSNGSCYSTTTYLLTVNGSPAVAAILGPNTVCANSSIQLNNGTLGGIWTSSSPLVATVDATGLVAALTPGTDSIKYTVTVATGCSRMVYKVITVLFGPVVLPITGSNSVCVGSTLQLNNSMPNGIWSSSNTSLATVSSSGAVLGLAAGNDTIFYTVTNANNCHTAAYKAITVYAVPVVPSITGPSSICLGSSIQLSNTLAGGIWTSDNTGIASVDKAGVVMGMASGNANITYTVSNGGCADSASVAEQVNTVDASVAQNVNELTSNQLGATYQWVSCPAYTYLTGQVSRIFTATALGQYAVIVYFNGCVDTSACLSVTSLGVNDAGMGNTVFEVYPNPAKNNITVETGNVVADVIRILDITGKELQRMVPIGSKTSILLRSYPAGVYQVEVIKGHDKQTKKLSIY